MLVQASVNQNYLPWPQLVQALTEVVVQKEIQCLHAVIQTLFQGHRRGAAKQNKHQSVTEQCILGVEGILALLEFCLTGRAQ